MTTVTNNNTIIIIIIESDTIGVGFVNKHNTTINNISITTSTTIKVYS